MLHKLEAEMNIINENTVLDYYLELIDKDQVSFLIGRDKFKGSISESINLLRNAENMHDKIQVAKGLWKMLFEAAMSFIDSDKRGYDELFKYFDEYVDFEELIFASDSFYRDHTLHCLWVYFLGTYLKSEKEFQNVFKIHTGEKALMEIMRELNKLDVEKHVKMHMSLVLDEITRMHDSEDSIFCVSALTHDLGYPIKKIHKINKSIKKVLPYYGLTNYDEFDFDYTTTQQHFIDRFIGILCTSVDVFMFSDNTDEVAQVYGKIVNRDNPDKVDVLIPGAIEKLSFDEKELLVNALHMKLSEVRDHPLDLRYTDDFEKYQHGIMSAFLLMKVVQAFKHIELKLNVNKAELRLYKGYGKYVAKRNILHAITDHTSEGFRISSIKGHSEFLTFIDELEEFSRISRANQNRQYINEFCKTDIYFEEGCLNIDFLFDNAEITNLDPEMAFKGRCNRFLKLFDITNLDENLRIKLRCIGELSYDKNTYMLEIANKFANITINGEEKDIPSYLKTRQFLTKEEYGFL